VERHPAFRVHALADVVLDSVRSVNGEEHGTRNTDEDAMHDRPL